MSITFEEYALENHSTVEEFFKACSSKFNFEKALKYRDGFEDEKFEELINLLEPVSYHHQYNYYGFSTIIFRSDDFTKFVNNLFNKLRERYSSVTDVAEDRLMRRFVGVDLNDNNCRSVEGNQILFRSHILIGGDEVTCCVIWTFFEEDIEEILSDLKEKM